VLSALGWYRVEVAGASTNVWRHAVPKARTRRPHGNKHTRQPKVEVRQDSPFAGLAALIAAK
jgi:hypothetical protein